MNEPHHIPCQCEACIARIQGKGYPRKTLRKKIAEQLTKDVMSNFEKGQYQMAGEHALAARFGASRITVRLALTDLEKDGVIYRKHGKGTFAYSWSEREARRKEAILGRHAMEMHTTLARIIHGGNAGLPETLENAKVLLEKVKMEMTL